MREDVDAGEGVAEGTGRCRGSVGKGVLVAVRALPEPGRSRILKRVPEATLRTLDEARGIQWLDGAHQIAVDRAMFAELGAEGLALFHADFTVEHAESPMFASVGRWALNAFGNGPGALLRAMPRLHRHSVQGMGDIEVSAAGDRRIVVKHVRLPAQRSDEVYAAVTRGTLLGILRFLERPGDVETDLRDLARGTVTHTVTWS